MSNLNSDREINMIDKNRLGDDSDKRLQRIRISSVSFSYFVVLMSFVINAAFFVE